MSTFRDLFTEEPRISREWAMPSPATFLILPISRLLDRWLCGAEIIVDPCCGSSTRATLRNDLRDGKEASIWLDDLITSGVRADAVLLDPPYSPRQISECYKSIGVSVTGKDTQNAALYRRLKDRLDALLVTGGIAVCCGWNSTGFGIKRGYVLQEILMVCHGAAHNDTIVTVERKGRVAGTTLALGPSEQRKKSVGGSR